VAAERTAETSAEQGSHCVGVVSERTITGSCLACRKATVDLLAVRDPQMCDLTSSLVANTGRTQRLGSCVRCPLSFPNVPL
jgi:hypothetical protein